MAPIASSLPTLLRGGGSDPKAGSSGGAKKPKGNNGGGSNGGRKGADGGSRKRRRQSPPTDLCVGHHVITRPVASTSLLSHRLKHLVACLAPWVTLAHIKT